jgi:hypothetical protein
MSKRKIFQKKTKFMYENKYIMKNKFIYNYNHKKENLKYKIDQIIIERCLNSY